MIKSSHVIRELAASLAGCATEVFGLMGNGNAHLIDELLKRGCSYTAVRHEAGTIAAADAYTRVSKQLAVATTTYGAGFTNALTALAEAIKARTPMLVVVGDEPEGGSRAIDVDQEMLTAALGTRSYKVGTSFVAETVEKAVSYALRVRKPVVINVPYDIVRGLQEPEVASAAVRAEASLRLNDPALLESLSQAVLGFEEPSRPKTLPINIYPTRRAGRAQIERAVQILRSADRPIVLAGRGAWLADAGNELSEIAHLLGAATASTALARGIFAEKEYDLGITGGFGADGAMALIKRADTVLVVGASLNQFTMRFGELFAAGARVVRVDLDAVAPPQTEESIEHLLVEGDARDALQSMISLLREEGKEPLPWRAEVAAEVASGRALSRATGETEYTGGLCADGLLDPRQVAVRIAELLPADTHLTHDGGHFIGWTNMFWPVASPERLTMVGTAFQTIGLGFATVAGVAKAAPDSTVVLSTGDGGGLMALADFETAIRTAESLLIVVWNDSAYGAEVHLYGVMGLDDGPMRIPTVDFAQLASSLGAKGVRVSTLQDLNVLKDWRDGGSKGALLLDCRVSSLVAAPYQREIQLANGLD